jgi:hypothetical protein
MSRPLLRDLWSRRPPEWVAGGTLTYIAGLGAESARYVVRCRSLALTDVIFGMHVTVQATEQVCSDLASLSCAEQCCQICRDEARVHFDYCACGVK